MKKFIFVVALVSGMTFETTGFGYNVNEALMDACDQLAKGDWPEDEIDDVELLKVEESC